MGYRAVGLWSIVAVEGLALTLFGAVLGAWGFGEICTCLNRLPTSVHMIALDLCCFADILGLQLRPCTHTCVLGIIQIVMFSFRSYYGICQVQL